MPDTKKNFAKEVREFFGFPEPGQKKLTQKELEKQIKAGKIPKKASEMR